MVPGLELDEPRVGSGILVPKCIHVIVADLTIVLQHRHLQCIANLQQSAFLHP